MFTYNEVPDKMLIAGITGKQANGRPDGERKTEVWILARK
jgi:hypothetical protein